MAVDPIRGAGGPQVQAAGTRTHLLFEQHSRMVYGLCRALLRDPHEADDATQATFVSAYKSLLGGSEVREPAAWLATIARNECAARARNRMREPLPFLEDDLGQAPGPEAELDRRVMVEELQQAISELPEKQREAVVLRDLYGLHYMEVGAALGVSVASVESLLFRARRKLRISLKPLASGALAVPLAVREGIAQALPAFSAAGAAGGGATSGAVGLGLLAKFAGGPVAVKAAAGLAAVVAAGSVAVVEVEHAGKQPSARAQTPSQQRQAGDARGGRSDTSVPGTDFVEHRTGPATVESGAGEAVSDDPGVGKGDVEAAGHGSSRSRDSSDRTSSAGSEQRGRDGATVTQSRGSDDAGGSSRSGHGGLGSGSAGSRGGHGSDDAGAPAQAEDLLGTVASDSGDDPNGGGGDSVSGSGSDRSEGSGLGGGSGNDEPGADGSEHGGPGHEDSHGGSGDGSSEQIPPPA